MAQTGARGAQKLSTGEAVNLMLGGCGTAGYTTAGTTYQGNWFALQMLQDTTFTFLNGDVSFQNGVSTWTFPAGTIIYGSFTAFRLASDSQVIAYYWK